MARSLHCAGARAGDVIHNAYGYGLFTGGLGAHYGAERLGARGGAGVGRLDRAAGGADRRLRRARAVRHAVLRAGHCRGGRSSRASTCARARCASACSAPSRGARRCAARSSRAWACRRSTSTACRRSWARAWRCECRAAGRHARLGGPFPVRGHRPREPCSPCPKGEVGELVITTLTKQALPMLRYRTRDITRITKRALCLRPHAPAHPARRRAQRRHADRARRQRLPVADRGGAGRPPGHRAALPAGAWSATARSTR